MSAEVAVVFFLVTGGKLVAVGLEKSVINIYRRRK